MTELTKTQSGRSIAVCTRNAKLPGCPCGSNRVRDLGPCRAYAHDGATTGRNGSRDGSDPGSLFRCESCALVFRCPAITAAEADALYASMTVDAWQYEFSANAAWNQAIQRMKQRTTASVLDIGSFDGQFLQGVPDAWKRAAIEPNPAAARRLSAAGIEAFTGSLSPELCEPLRGRFDVVTMFDVFEHLLDPIAGLTAAVSCVRPGGVLWISTGNADHWTWRLLGSEHPYLAPSQHVVFGSEAFFRGFCVRQGLTAPDCMRIPHQVRSLSVRARATIQAAYFGARRRGGIWKVIVHGFHAWPGTRGWLHRNGMPHISELADHLFVEIQC